MYLLLSSSFSLSNLVSFHDMFFLINLPFCQLSCFCNSKVVLNTVRQERRANTMGVMYFVVLYTNATRTQSCDNLLSACFNFGS